MALESNGLEVTRDYRSSFDVIDINTIGPKSAYVAHKMRWKDTPVAIHTHTTAEDIRDSFIFSTQIAPKVKKYLRYFYDQADILISPTKYAKDVVRGYGVKKEIMVISNGVDTQKFRPDRKVRDRFRKKNKLDGETIYCVGHVFKRKGVLDFLKIAKTFEDHRFLWVGRLYKNLVSKKVVKACEGKPENVTFTGYVRDVVHVHLGCDILLFPSYCENQGISVLEAAACGKPMVVRDIKAYDGWLVDGKNCLMADSQKMFKRHIQSLIEDERLRKKLGKNAQKMAQKHSLKSVGSELVDAYAGITR